MPIFGHSKFLPVFLFQKGLNKFGMCIFGHAEFVPVFLGKIVGTNGHFWPFQIYTSLFGKNCRKKFRMAIFGHSEFIPVFLEKIVRKNSKQPFLVILNLYQSFWEKLSEKIWNSYFWPFQIYTSLFGKNCQKKFRMAILGHSEFIPVFLGEIVSHFWPFPIYTSLFGGKLSQKIQNSHFWPF